MSSPIVFGGKMSAVNFMDDENLFVTFPLGMANGNIAHVLGTWTQDASGKKKAPLAMVGYTCRFFTDTEFFILKEGGFYRLKVDISGETLDVLLSHRDEPHSQRSTLYKLK
ncbi:hypothetical protein EDB87DRAFT_1577629 [Lactarius vividus]|nr:hypothetical protein EDB87DRAFT_1577629 [Lactarius vividus]